MKKVVPFAAFALAVSLLPSIGNAATITPVTESGSVHTNPFFPPTPSVYSGIVTGSSQLSFTTDFLEFLLSPPPSPTVATTVTVNLLTSLAYAGETWQLCSSLACAVPLLAGTPSNVGQTISLPTGADYWVEFASTAAPTPFGISTFSVSTPTPLPGALPLLMAGLGVLGFGAWRKRSRPQRSLAAA